MQTPQAAPPPDDIVAPPYAPGDTVEALARRMAGASSTGTLRVDAKPGWDWAVITGGLKGALVRYNSSLKPQRVLLHG
jgi:hypothetical protein